jgi:hypothetical protein
MTNLGRGGGIIDEYKDALSVQDGPEERGALVERLWDAISR